MACYTILVCETSNGVQDILCHRQDKGTNERKERWEGVGDRGGGEISQVQMGGLGGGGVRRYRWGGGGGGVGGVLGGGVGDSQDEGGNRGWGPSPEPIVPSASAYSFSKHVLMRVPLNTLIAETKVSSASSSRLRFLSASPISLSEVASFAELSRNATVNCTTPLPLPSLLVAMVASRQAVDTLATKQDVDATSPCTCKHGSD